MSTTTRTARLMDRLADAEAALTTARREQARTAKATDRAADRVSAARTDLADATKALRTAERTGQGVKAAQRAVAARAAKLEKLLTAAAEAKATATTARRAAAAAARRRDAAARRAAFTAARAVEAITARLAGTGLAPAAETDRVLDAAEIPAVEEIEDKARQFAALDAQAKNFARQADGLKTWLRTLPTGVYGRVVVSRIAGRSVLDNAQVAVDYAARGEMPPRKATRLTFKVDASAVPAATAADEFTAAA